MLWYCKDTRLRRMEQVVVRASSSSDSDTDGESYSICRRLHCICDCQVADKVLLVVGTYNTSVTEIVEPLTMVLQMRITPMDIDIHDQDTKS